jgi:putative membrane protein
MKGMIMIVFAILLLNVVLVLANGDHQSEIEEGKELVESRVNCDQLNDEQFEAIGEYYMEQMHPRDAHEVMHEMMGVKEGTEQHKQVHVNMAKAMYCGKSGMIDSGGMMEMMQGMMGSENMMCSGGMMNMMRTSMMGGLFGDSSLWLWGIVEMLFWVALLIALVLLIIWLYRKIVGKAAENSSALQILKKRFAKGEITKKEFESMKKKIR